MFENVFWLIKTRKSWGVQTLLHQSKAKWLLPLMKPQRQLTLNKLLRQEHKFLHLGQYKTPLGCRFRLLSISLQDRFCGRKEEKRCGNTKGPLGPVQTPLCPCEIRVLMMYVWYSYRDLGKARLKNLKSALWHLYDMSRNSSGFILLTV